MTNRVREFRVQRDWTQAELGTRLDVTRQTIISIESGRYEPSLGLAFKIAGVFGKRIEDVFQPEAGPQPEPV